MRDFNGNYSQYREEVESKKLESQKVRELESKKSAASSPPPVTSKVVEQPAKEERKPEKTKEKQRMGFNEKWEFSLLEKELPELEKKKEALVEKLNSGISDTDELMKVSEELTETIEAIDRKTNLWLELSEMTS